MNTDTQIVILAAGKGTRMGGDLPKALVELGGKPMVHYVLESAQKFTQNKPITVVGYKGELVKESLSGASLYALQEEQKGTGHAVLVTKDLLQDISAETVIICYADQPYVSAETMHELARVKSEKDAKIVIATSVIEDSEMFENQFYNFGRIIRDENNVITRIVEKKDASEAELAVREVNPAYFCLDKKWMLARLAELKNENAQGEYYLTDLVQMAFDEGLIIESVQIEPREALGANSREQLAVLETFLAK